MVDIEQEIIVTGERLNNAKQKLEELTAKLEGSRAERKRLFGIGKEVPELNETIKRLKEELEIRTEEIDAVTLKLNE